MSNPFPTGLQANESGHLGMGLRRPAEGIPYPLVRELLKKRQAGLGICLKVPMPSITKHLIGLCATLQEVKPFVSGIQLSSSSVTSGKRLMAAASWKEERH